MTVTRLKRKHRKNIARANNKQHIIKELLRTPVLKNVDLEELKSRFAPTGVAGAVAAVKKTAAAAATKVKEVADSVAHSDVVEKAKDVVEGASEKVADTVDSAKENLGDAATDAKDAAVKAKDATVAAANDATPKPRDPKH